jgi:hypothetical protein
MPHHALRALLILPEPRLGATELEILYLTLIAGEVKDAPRSDRDALSAHRDCE